MFYMFYMVKKAAVSSVFGKTRKQETGVRIQNPEFRIQNTRLWN